LWVDLEIVHLVFIIYIFLRGLSSPSTINFSHLISFVSNVILVLRMSLNLLGHHL